MTLQAIIFDLGGTLIDWPDWTEDAERRWGLAYSYLMDSLPNLKLPTCEIYVQAMRQAEAEHWRRVSSEQMSSTPEALLLEGFRLLGISVPGSALLIALDGYAHAVDGWSIIFPDTIATLQALRQRGYKLGLLSNTWWAAAWHNADLATHGLTPFFDTIVYTSDLPFSKPHPQTFLTVTHQLGVEPEQCMMVGDRMIDDISGALSVGMRAVWKDMQKPWPRPAHIIPSAVITNLAELLPLVDVE